MILIFLISGILLSIGFKSQAGKRAVPYELSKPAVEHIEPNESPAQVVIQEGEADPEMIIVHVEGQVELPGVYELPQESRVMNAIEAAGGLTAGADRSQVNLAKKINDEEQIYIPKEGEIRLETQGQTGANNGASPGGKLVNINQASKEELTTLPGVGPALAERILAYRRDHGSFKGIEDIMQVSGIGEKKFEALKEYITTN